MTNEALRQAETLFSQSRWAEAKALLLPFAAETPKNPDILNALAAVAWQEGAFEEAFRQVTEALNIDPYHRDALLNYANMLAARQRLDEAAFLLESYCALYPEDAEMAEFWARAKATKPQPIASVSCLGQNPCSAKTQDPLDGAKVLHAPFEVGGCIARFSRFLRREGVDATGVNYHDTWFRYRCDINLGVSALPPESRMPAIERFAKEAIERYDIFHFHFANSLFPDLRELELLKERGKKVLFSFWGSDSRAQEAILYHQAKFLGFAPPRPYFNTLEQYAALKHINQYADVLLGLTCIPRYLFYPGFCDTHEWSLAEKQRQLALGLIDKDPKKLYILHAPTVNWKKGSSYILPVLEKLKAKGLPIELLYLSGVKPHEARRIYAYADVLVDQVSIGTFGLLAIEMMCWETPVMVYHTPYHDRTRDYPPVLKINSQPELESMVERALAMKASGELAEIGRKSRIWALEHTDVRDTIPELIRIYRELLAGREVAQYVDRGWYQQEQKILNGEKNDFYRYMKEEGAFKAMGAVSMNYDTRLYT